MPFTASSFNPHRYGLPVTVFFHDACGPDPGSEDVLTEHQPIELVDVPLDAECHFCAEPMHLDEPEGEPCLF